MYTRSDRYRPYLLTGSEWFFVALLLAVATMLGCSNGLFHSIRKATDNPTVSTGQYAILDVIAGACSIGAVGLVIASIAVPLPVLRKLAGGCLACAVGSWVLKLLLVKYLWIAVLFAVISALIVLVSYLYGHRKWVERKLNVDLDGGGVGQ